MEGETDGEISIFLEKPGKVSYRAELDPSKTLPTEYDLGYRYGEHLTKSTPAFSNMTGFFRRIEDGTEIVQQLLAGSDKENKNSVFYGSTGRTADDGDMANQAFLNDLGFGVDGNFNMLVDPDGTATSSVTAGGSTGANFEVDLTPGGTPDPFTFNELILQVEHQGETFGDQIGDTGQKFTFTSFSSRAVPSPTAAFGGLMLLGGLALRRRRRAV